MKKRKSFYSVHPEQKPHPEPNEKTDNVFLIEKKDNANASG